MTRKKIKLGFSKKNLAVLAAAMVIAFGGWYFGLRKDEPKTEKSLPEDNSYVNLNPPTAAEKQETEAHKRSLTEDTTTTPPTTPSGKKQVTPVVTSADSSSARGYVSGIIEDGGVCTFTFTRSGSQTKTTASEAFADATTTVCNPVNTSGLNLVSGQWTVVLSYSSSKAEGKSRPMTFEVQ